jgi:hypothetical protein
MKREWSYTSIILYLYTRWKWMVSFTPRPLYPWKKSPLYPLDRRLGGPQSRSGRCGAERNVLPLPGIELCRYTDWAIHVDFLNTKPYHRTKGIFQEFSHNTVMQSVIQLRTASEPISMPGAGYASQVILVTNHLTVEMLIIARLLRSSHYFIEPEYSFPHSQQPTSGPCSESHQSNVHHPILFS